ncbi:MAG: hypothetical protein P4L31_07315 [Candidatus Babeliales bacterium]|nr:hypothetical protein [Candidatus Babeliales bacterium]
MKTKDIQLAEIKKMFPYTTCKRINDWEIKIGCATYQENIEDDLYDEQFDDFHLQDGTIFIKQ